MVYDSRKTIGNLNCELMRLNMLVECAMLERMIPLSMMNIWQESTPGKNNWAQKLCNNKHFRFSLRKFGLIFFPLESWWAMEVRQIIWIDERDISEYTIISCVVCSTICMRWKPIMITMKERNLNVKRECLRLLNSKEYIGIYLEKVRNYEKSVFSMLL